MATLAESASDSASQALKVSAILWQSIRIYRSNFLSLLVPFLLPATGRLLWTIAQRLFVHSRHPGWPQAGVLVNTDWGLSIYWSTMVLTCAGLLVYFILAGPALALTARIIAASARCEGGQKSSRFLPRYLGLQFLSALRAWGLFIAGLTGTVIIGATLLNSSPDQGLPIWYALDAFTFLVGLPVGVWLSLRYFLAIPSACMEVVRTKDSYSSSTQLTNGIKMRLLAAISAVLALRWCFGLLAGWSLGYLARTFAGAATVSTFLLIPIAMCILDGLFGPLWGVSAALLYRQKSMSAQPSSVANS